MAIEAGQINPNHPFFFHGVHLPTDVLLRPLPPELSFPSPPPSGLACNEFGKRCREYDHCSSMTDDSQRPRFFAPSMLERDVAFQFHHQQREFECLVALHTQWLSTELEERSRALVSAARVAVTVATREKDEEMLRLSKLNFTLQERLRGLSAENELWRGLALSNEATANSLRSDLKRVLTSSGIVDAASCCGSSNGASPDDDWIAMRRGCKGDCGGRNEAGVMLMPCLHLCLCAICGSGSRQCCPVCGSDITASSKRHFGPEGLWA